MLDTRNIFKLLSLLAYLLFNHFSKCVNIPKQVNLEKQAVSFTQIC